MQKGLKAMSSIPNTATLKRKGIRKTVWKLTEKFSQISVSKS